MRLIFFTIFFCCTRLCASSQELHSADCIKTDVPVKIYLSILDSNGKVERSKLSAGFRLKTVDTSYSVIGFAISYADARKDSGTIYVLPVKGDSLDVNLDSARRYTANIHAADMIGIEWVRLKKNGQCYIGPLAVFEVSPSLYRRKWR